MTGAMELQPNDGLRSSLSIVGRFVEGIGKLAGNMSGDCWKKTIKLVARMPEAIGLEGKFGKSQVQASSRSEDDAVENSPGVRRKLTEGTESLPG
ncbi:hypothetical protein BHM03_00037360 [Ensete ventricosum]|nr:hypothetical protein BHM03_00037360 [Ensete ventricosum]